MNSKKIETMAISTVRESIIITDYLDEFISENDKEPSWDGFVYIYSDKRQIKKEIIGRVAVQVKGKLVNSIGKKTISYPVSTVDLENYLKDRGIVFFVVQILKKETTERKIYYTSLAPIDLRNYLRKPNTQKTISITLKEFPSDNIQKSNIFLNCYHHFQKQTSFSKDALPSIQELSKINLLDTITIPTYSFSKTRQSLKAQILNTDQIYVYAKIKGTNIEQPLEDIIHNLRIDEKYPFTISINHNKFYDFCLFRQTKDNQVLKIGDSLQITVNDNYVLEQFNYKESNKLKDAIKDLDFFLSILQFGYFELNNHKCYINKETLNLRNFNKRDQENRLNFLKNIATLLDLLHINKNLDLSALTDKDFNNIDMLVSSLIENKTVTGINSKVPALCYIDIAMFKVLVFLQEEDKGVYKISDFFNNTLETFINDENKNTFPVSQYSILRHQHFTTASNIKFDNLLSDFQRIGYNSENIICANNIMLFMLKAYDIGTDKKDTLIKTIKAFSAWLIAIDKRNYLPKELKTLNNLQIICRERELTPEEFHALYKITEKRSVHNEILVGAFLLIGDQSKAKFYFQRLTTDVQQAFKDYPIYHFWK